MADPLLPLTRDYPTAVLSWVEPGGSPASVRCRARWVDGTDAFELTDVPPFAAASRGPACLLFHMHDPALEGLRQMVVKGDLAADEPPPGEAVAAADNPVLRFTSTGVVTANGRSDTDRLPHAAAPLHMFQFFLVGRRQAQAYLRRRGAPWPPIPYDEIGRRVREHG